MSNSKKVIICGMLMFLILIISVSVVIINIRLDNSNNVVNDIYQNVVVNDNSIDSGFKYKIYYYDGYEPGSVYNIYVYDNYDILVDATHFIGIPGNEPRNIINKLVYKDDVKNELVDYFEYLFKNDDDNYIEINGEPDYRSYDYVNLSKIVKYDKDNLLNIYKYDLSNDYDYKLSYSMISDYEIYKVDNIVKVEKKSIFSEKNAEFIINFNDVNMKKIDEIFKQLFVDTEKKELKLEYSEVTYEQRNVLNAIIKNDEMYMNYIFILTDISCNCFSNEAYFLEDGTYIAKSVEINEEYDILSRGKYDYDINKILNNLDNFEENSDYMNYKITLYDGREYIVSHYDLRMISLLNGLDIKWH